MNCCTTEICKDCKKAFSILGFIVDTQEDVEEVWEEMEQWQQRKFKQLTEDI